jgi:UDP-N-acetylglucosamine 2-epimerase (non-hydrolysing)
VKRILSVVGARPNFMKLAPVQRALEVHGGFEHVVVHTGQHYDRGMSDTFFEDLGIPDPDHNLGVGSGTHAQQTADIMKAIEPVLLAERPDVLLVYGDVNSTVAAAKLGIGVGHVEAGLRSFDWEMPEEINRVVTDRLSDLLFTPSRDGDENLLREGVAAERIHFVGNVMIDTLARLLPEARRRADLAGWGVREREFAVVTLHRPSNVDEARNLAELISALGEIGRDRPVLFPVHRRTRRRLAEFGLVPPEGGGLRLVDPVGYVEMLGLVDRAGLVVADSGGLQKETSFLGVPCLTVRPNTERPVTITHGTNELVPTDRAAIVAAAERRFGAVRDGCEIELWDGHAAERIAGVLASG